MNPDDVTFSPLTEDQIALLETMPWSAGLRSKHRARFERQQQGEVVYLIAWEEHVPIGHMLIHWTGPQNEPIASQLTGCAEIEDFVVRPDLRSRGIGRRMLATAEDLARQQGFRWLGLGVGLGNARARALYESVGYHDSGLGVYTVRWQYIGRDGQTHWDDEVCAYLVKELSAGAKAVEQQRDERERTSPAGPDPAERNETPDPVEEADLESFPASDPPAWAGGHDTEEEGRREDEPGA